MAGETWTFEELFEGLDPQPAFVSELERLGLLRVVARDPEGRPLYGAEAQDELQKVMGLVELGYQPRDIAAIARKVGLPERRRRLFRRTPTFLRLDELARVAGVTPELLSSWVEQGLIRPELISEGGEAHFDAAGARRVRLLDDLLVLGLEAGDVARWAETIDALDEPAGVMTAARIAEAEALLASLGARVERARKALRRWDKLSGSYKKRLSRLRRSLGGDTKAPRTGRRRRTRTRTRAKMGPGSDNESS